MRGTLANIFLTTVEKNSNAYILSGDHGYALFDPLRKTYPKHFLNAGIAEQNMVGVAAGMSKNGMLPIVYGLGSFIPMRVVEQIKLDICFEKLKVLFIGDGAGAVYTTLGVSHQTFEDIATLRSLPEIQIYSPSDDTELKWAFNEALNYSGPSYIRIGKADLGIFNDDVNKISSAGITALQIGKKDKPIILATGSMVSAVMPLMKNEFKDFSLYSVCRLKPLSASDLTFLAENKNEIFTIEEHNTIGGLGSLICEIVTSKKELIRPVHRIGSRDHFTQLCGDYQYAMSEHFLTTKQIREQIIEKIN